MHRSLTTDIVHERSPTRPQRRRNLTERLEEQQGLVEAIAATVPDLIGVKGRDRRYLWVNRAFANAFARSPDSLVGAIDRDLFGVDDAQRLDRTDREALALSIVVVDDELLDFNGRERILHSVKVPLRLGDGTLRGVVWVARDVTEAARLRRQRERQLEAVTTTLIRAVELADPYLVGHSRRLEATALAIATRLNLTADEAQTLRLAARLSQIGKLFVPREILVKPGRHSEYEQALMREHVGHAQRLLEGAGLDLPVAEALAQMHERLDGTGYPNGLGGSAISRVGRVLAVADVYCARTEPRSYRGRWDPMPVLELFRKNGHRYDPEVVAALAAHLDTAVGRDAG